MLLSQTKIVKHEGNERNAISATFKQTLTSFVLLSALRTLSKSIDGGQHSTMVCILASGPSCPGSIPSILEFFFREKIVDLAEVNQ